MAIPRLRPVAGSGLAPAAALAACCALFAGAPLAAAPARRAPARPAAAATAPAAAAPSSSPNVLRDRVLAVVDDDSILLSDFERTIVLGQVKPNPGESEAQFRRRVLDQLIAERLRFHEIDRFGFEQVPVDQIEKNVAEIRSRFKDEAAFRQKLAELGLDMTALRQLVARQLEVLAYVDERLGPQVFVGLDDITAYYRNVLTPEMQRQHQPVPPVEEVREQIRAVLKQQRLVQEIDRWTEELRRKSNVTVYLDQPAGPLPPVVQRIDKAAAKKPASGTARSKPPG
ncbi:MAG TPA: hypothetical protein VHQ90_26165 [Thermoanaerobaculia bacterium]|nr:hypothetical protein [Thermoanaerobaculia bacterium]